MAAYYLALLLAAFSFTPICGLQVTPNSGCASVCIDYYGADPSDSNVSNTNGSDVVCSDRDYSTTVAGLKYRNCINCLQNSTAATSGETDQAWFLYNLRYTFNTCLFASTNTSNPIQSPCALDSVCSPLRAALETDMQKPSKVNEYSYCTANDTGVGFTSSYLATCQQCLQQNTNAFYLSNFLIALDAGCLQQPANGSLIGLSGTLFSHNQVQITDPLTIATAAAQLPHKVLTRGAIAGIVVGGLGGALIAAACIFVCTKKQYNSTRLNRLRSPLNPRFGAPNTSAPMKGAFVSPKISPPMGGMYKSPKFSFPLENERAQMMRAPSIRNFSIRNFGIHRHHQEKQNTGRANTQRSQRTPESFSPGPPMCSPQNSRRDPFPAHHAYISPQNINLSRTNETPSRNNSLPRPVVSNLQALAHSIPAPPRARFPQTAVPYVSTMPPITYQSRVPTNFPITRLPDPVHEHPPDAQISAPIMMIGTRFESDVDARRARERPNREGFWGRSTRRNVGGQGSEIKSPAEKSSPQSASSAVSQEMWPGSF